MERLEALVEALPGAGSDADRRALVEDFLDAVVYGEEGLPIREEGRLGFAWWGDDPSALTVAGDFNGWDPSAEPLVQPVPGLPFLYALVDVDEPLPRTLYKFVRDGAEWTADPRARRYGYDGYGEHSLAEPGEGVSHLQRWPGFSGGAGDLLTRDLAVYVPAEAEGPLPVLYLQDGQNLFDPDGPWGGWRASEAADAAIASGVVAPFLMVGIPNTEDRFDEYTHVPDDIGVGEPVGGRAGEYAAFLADGVVPFVDARYPTLAEPAGRGVLGSSLGGLASFFAAWARPDRFGHSGAMSGTFGWGSIGLGGPTLMAEFAAAPPDPALRFYIDSGGGDGGGCRDADGDGVRDDTPGAEDNYCETLDMAETLRSLGFQDEEDLFHRWVPGASHDEAAWAERLPGVLETWFPGPRSRRRRRIRHHRLGPACGLGRPRGSAPRDVVRGLGCVDGEARNGGGPTRVRTGDQPVMSRPL